MDEIAGRAKSWSVVHTTKIDRAEVAEPTQAEVSSTQNTQEGGGGGGLGGGSGGGSTLMRYSKV